MGIEEAGLLLDIHAGRPDVPQILADTALQASALGPKGSVGVFIGGGTVHLQCVAIMNQWECCTVNSQNASWSVAVAQGQRRRAH